METRYWSGDLTRIGSELTPTATLFVRQVNCDLVPEIGLEMFKERLLPFRHKGNAARLEKD